MAAADGDWGAVDWARGVGAAKELLAHHLHRRALSTAPVQLAPLCAHLLLLGGGGGPDPVRLLVPRVLLVLAEVRNSHPTVRVVCALWKHGTQVARMRIVRQEYLARMR